MLDILDGEADLSRRVVLYEMQGMSFREYLEMFEGIKTSVRSLDDILMGNIEIKEVLHPIPLFNKYLKE